MAPLYRKVIAYTVIYSISALTAIGVLFKIIYIWLTSPSGTVFKVKNRPTPPECLNNPELGEHKYIQLKVSKFII